MDSCEFRRYDLGLKRLFRLLNLVSNSFICRGAIELVDAFQAERDQAVTIDTTQIWFSTDERDYVIIDAPGHREFLKNMVSGAAAADAAILVIDAAEGVQEQTRRHAYLLHLLGLRQVAVVINKMDAINKYRNR